MFNVLKDEKTIHAYGEIGWPTEGFTAADFLGGLAQFGGDDITIQMQSPGGDVTEGKSIYHQIKNYSGRVTMRIDSLSASMATVVALGADYIEAFPQSEFMVHNPWGMVIGDATDLRNQAKVLDMLGEDLLDIYTENTGQSRQYWKATMDGTTWYRNAEAMEVGLIHAETQPAVVPVAAAAKVQKSGPRPRLAALHATRARLRANIDKHRREA